VADGSTIYIGGDFTHVGPDGGGAGATRNHIAAIDAATGVPTPLEPNANGQIYSLALSGGTLYVGGLFTSVAGQPRNNIAALDVATGAATARNPNASSDVEALVVSGGRVYAGGHFGSIGGQPREKIAALDAATGAATAWNPNPRTRAAPPSTLRSTPWR
jgi:trimeric autotransporter adhesin